MTIRELLDHGRRMLAGGSTRALEAELLLCRAIAADRTRLYACPEDPVPESQCETFFSLLQRRLEGEPVAYLTGTREFWSLPLKVTRDVLIPRPETELLVETALESIPADAEWRIADLGTGSGAVALALASERPRCEVHATESSQAALSVARRNAGNLQRQSRICFHLGNWLEPLEGKFQVIVSNPPYVASNDPHLEEGDCRFEPRQALTPGSDGMAAIRHIAEETRNYLAQGGMLAFEHGHDQGHSARRLLAQLAYDDVITLRDLAGLERVTRGTWNG